MTLPWTVKYRPKRIEEVVGNVEAKKKFLEWIESWVKGRPSYKAALLYGPPGTGKTSLVEATAKTYGFDLVELNASDQRAESVIRRVVEVTAVQGSLFGSGRRIVLLDEVDGMTGEDRGGLKAIARVIGRTRQPIVLTANDAWNPKLSNLRPLCLLIEFKRLKRWEVVRKLKEVCFKEGVEADKEALDFIAKRSEGDLRSALNDLQTVAQGRRRITLQDVLWLTYRNRDESIFQVLSIIFNAKTAATARRAASLTDLDPEMLFEWIYENAPRQLTDPYDLASAMENLAKADLTRSRVKRLQMWHLLSYFVELMTGGVAVAREKTKPKWTPLKFPERIKLLSASKAERELIEEAASKIASECHVSKKTVLTDILPYILFILKHNRRYGETLLKTYGLTGGEISLLRRRAEA